MPTADSTPDRSLEKLTLDSQSKTTTVTEPTKQDFYGDDGSLVYHQQSYGYVPYEPYPASSSPLSAIGQDGQHQTLQEYHYPGSYYQPPAQTSSDPVPATASQVEVSTSSGDQASLSSETIKGNPTAVVHAGRGTGNNGSRPRPTFQNTSWNQNSSYRRGNFPAHSPSPGFQDPWAHSYDGNLLAVPWFDSSMSSDGRSTHAASNGYSSYSSNSPGGNQNIHLYPQFMNGSAASGFGQAYGFMNHFYPNSMTYSHYGNAFGANSCSGSFGYSSWKKGQSWYPAGNNSKPRGRGYGKENMDELNRGPRVKGYKNQNGFEPETAAVKEKNSALSEDDEEKNVSLLPDMEQYNKEDFPESYSDARFFVIKSYSEDDVHKSIKYGVWASTSNGNKKLDAAYNEAKEKPDGCPVFLLFSVNTSGQFVGLAEMAGPVDFNKTLEYWQQDKWIGCFPVKWHIIKDVPNSFLRHITLENNENKPVTNSRDTQEVCLEQGLQILKIFKTYSSKTCILDDFEFYESRQKMMQEKKAKHQLSQKQVLEQPSIDVVTDSSEKAVIERDVPKKSTAALTSISTTVEVVKVNGEATPLENGSVADADDAPAEPVSVASLLN